MIHWSRLCKSAVVSWVWATKYRSTAFKMLERLTTMNVQNCLMSVKRTIQSSQLKSPVAECSFLIHHDLWDAVILQVSKIWFVAPGTIIKVGRRCAYIKYQRFVCSKEYNITKNIKHKCTKTPYVRKNSPEDSFHLLVYTSLFVHRKSEGSLKLKKEKWEKLKEVFWKLFRCRSCGKKIHKWQNLVRFVLRPMWHLVVVEKCFHPKIICLDLENLRKRSRRFVHAQF